MKENKNAKKDSSHLVPPVNRVGQLTAGLGLESGRGWDSGSALRMINMIMMMMIMCCCSSIAAASMYQEVPGCKQKYSDSEHLYV